MSESTEQSKSPRRWDTSVIIALIAVSISLFSTYISLQESRIMRDQQLILAEQQESSVWPYLENRQINNFNSDTSVTISYKVTNKGVGPAIIDSVSYLYKEQSIKGWGLGAALREDFPNLKIYQLGNYILDGMVLAPGEVHTVATEKIVKPRGDTTQLSRLVNNLDFRLEYCYCSVYGKCWRVFSKTETKPSEDCEFRENIR